MQTHVARSLHDDHVATLAVLARLEALLGRHGPTAAPDAMTPPVAALLRDLARAVTQELGPHFAFEEDRLFPLLADSEAAEMLELLRQEHGEILPIAQRLAELARQGQAQGFGPAAWVEFHAAAAALAPRLAMHVEKEEMGLLPALDALLDAETDSRLALEFAAQR